MNILITGGTGFIGTALCRELRNTGHTVIVTSRRRSDSKEKLTWDPPDLIPPDVISNFDAVINLAGEPIASGRWTKEKKRKILSSRVTATRALVDSMRNAGAKPGVLISASAIGYYGAHGDEYVTEDTPPSSDFLADVCVKWEAEALKAQEFGTRVVITRIGGVLESDGGALPQMIIPFKFFLGGPIGSGKQWFSWVHRDDVVGIMKYALEHDTVSGPVNATAPNPVTNKEFSTALGKALNRPSCFAVPGFVVELTLGELGKVLLTGQRVLPGKALNAGYQFKYTEVNDALKAIFKKSSKQQVVQ
ncbi:MAG: TIGR01777 family protein [Nitrospiraceae bacterium]|nr:MAG: TIGR01777 family protein [Nitrospiraceae bacterium]